MNNFFLLINIISIFLQVIPNSSFLESPQKKQIAFIVNPISHRLKKYNIENIIKKNLDCSQFEYKIFYSKYPNHAAILTENILVKSPDIIVAVGGDGTINEVGKVLVNTKTTLAIIPAGSGNGLARHLGIPVGLTKAIKALNDGSVRTIDTVRINDKTFLNVAGIGFDAHIAHKFAIFGKRGFFSYFLVAANEFSLYKPKSYVIIIDGVRTIKKAFVLTFANSSQYGNNFIIAPKANITDGYFELVIIDDVPIYSIPELIYRFKNHTIDCFNHCTIQQCKELTIRYPNMQAHIDGEVMFFTNEIKVIIQPKSLKVFVPNNARLHN